MGAFLANIDWRFFLVLLLVVLGFLLGAAYLSACAGAERWLKLREWLGPWHRKKEKDK
jgi:cell division protein FtsW (lipid II flippase)